jgi:hypothetical protein
VPMTICQYGWPCSRVPWNELVTVRVTRLLQSQSEQSEDTLPVPTVPPEPSGKLGVRSMSNV